MNILWKSWQLDSYRGFETAPIWNWGADGAPRNFILIVRNFIPGTHGAEYQTKTYRRRERGSCKSPRNQKNCKLLIIREMQKCDLLGETKLVPPRKGKNANYLSIKHVYLRVARGDFLERMGQQFLKWTTASHSSPSLSRKWSTSPPKAATAMEESV